jgi:hypothetical protein
MDHGRDEIENINMVVLSLPLFRLSFPSKIKYLWVDDGTNDKLICADNYSCENTFATSSQTEREAKISIFVV